MTKTITLSEALTRGYELQTKGKPAAAVELYMRVIAERPNYPEAWVYLGMALHDLKRFGESEDAYRQALKLRPQFSVALNNLGNTLRMLGRTEEALEAFDEAVRCQPGYVNAMRNRATALYWAGRIGEAEAGFLEVLAEDAENAETRKDLGVLRLLTGRYREGWEDYEYRWKVAGAALPRLPGGRWEGEEIAGKTLLLVAEQGLGDTVQFARYGRLVRERFGCRVVAQVQDALVPLLAGSAEGMGLDEVVGRKGVLPAFDVWVPMLSLPGVLELEPGEFAGEGQYLVPEEGRFGEVLAGYEGLKVGVAWQGNPGNAADLYRSFPLSALAPLARLEGVTLFSLQKGAGAEQVAEFGGALGLVDLGPQLDNSGGAFVETAALVKQLDLVVSADTALAHVAGALGVPVWIALAQVPDWRWGLEAGVTPWYPTMRIFRQREAGAWMPVFREMAAELARLRSRVVWHPIPEVAKVEIPVSPGEFVDRLTILEVKEERIADEGKLRDVRAELEALREVRDGVFGEFTLAEIEVLAVQLKGVNEALWDAEDALRKMEAGRRFGGEFITVARSIYRMNDRRAALKREINGLMGAAWQEAKSYEAY